MPKVMTRDAENGRSKQMRVIARASFIPFTAILSMVGMFRAAFTTEYGKALKR